MNLLVNSCFKVLEHLNQSYSTAIFLFKIRVYWSSPLYKLPHLLMDSFNIAKWEYLRLLLLPDLDKDDKPEGLMGA